jgi:exopolysaccharide biosynthesis polyprenyl glycosylphosphotransferase
MLRLFRVHLPANTVALFLADTFLVLFCFVFALYFTTNVAPRVYLLDDGGIWRVLLVELVILLGFYFHDMYQEFRIQSRILLVQNVCVTLGVAFVLQSLLSYGRWNLLLPKWDMVFGSVGVLVLLPVWRIAYSAAISHTVGDQRVLFLGASKSAREIMQGLAVRPELGWKALGYLDDDAREDSLGVPRLGSIDNLDPVVAELRPDRLVVALGDRRNGLPMERLLELRTNGLQIEETSQTFEYVLHRVSTRDLRVADLVFSGAFGPRPHRMILQGLYSWVFAAALAAVTLPLTAIVAVLVKLTSRGPVFYRQTRAGLNGAPFVLYKFRSMTRDAEAVTGAVWSQRDDPRVTPLGRLLRRFRLDELPQLFNVLRGEMSMVGPRPERPEFVKVLQSTIPYYTQRLAVKPGITGWAQINHKYGDSVDDTIVKLEYDLYYIKHGATSLDLYILFHTFKTMLLGRGAQ